MITEEVKEIIEVLKHTLGYDAPHITQEHFEKIKSYYKSGKDKNEINN